MEGDGGGETRRMRMSTCSSVERVSHDWIKKTDNTTRPNDEG